MAGVCTTKRYAMTIQHKYIYLKFCVAYSCAHCKSDI